MVLDFTMLYSKTLVEMNTEKIKKDKEINKKIRLSLLKQWELIDMIVDMEKTITKYEDKERHNAKQGKADAS